MEVGITVRLRTRGNKLLLIPREWLGICSGNTATLFRVAIVRLPMMATPSISTRVNGRVWSLTTSSLLIIVKLSFTTYFFDSEAQGTPSSEKLPLLLAYYTMPSIFRTPSDHSAIKALQTAGLWMYVVGSSDFGLRFTLFIFSPVLEDFARRNSDGVWGAFDPTPIPYLDKSGELFCFGYELALLKEMAVLQKNN